MRHLRSLVVLACIGLAACGGGNSSSSSSSGSSKPKKTHTPTPTPSLQTIYVRENGNDDNPGTDRTKPLKSISAAAKLAKAGTTIDVGPGTYTGSIELNNKKGVTAEFPIRIFANVPAGGVAKIDAGGATTAIAITKTPFVTIEGFLITGVQPASNASATAVIVRTNSHDTTIRDCRIGNAAAVDAVRVDGSPDVLIFNNLIFSNDRGVVITGDTQRTRIINNTIVDHMRAGVSVSAGATTAPEAIEVFNNIIQGNAGHIGISIDDPVSYTGDYNLVFEPDVQDQATIYRSQARRGAHDINEDALFENIPTTDVRLTADSPAIDAGATTIGQDLLADLFQRSATSDEIKDRTPPDLGYHQPPPR